MHNEFEFDGVYFMPNDDDTMLEISYFNFKDDMAGGKPVETEMGSWYHVAFFKEDEEGQPKFDDSFEAIFACPKTYVNNLAGAGVYGCIVKKTDKSGKWFDNYLKKVLTSITIKKMRSYAESIANS